MHDTLLLFGATGDLAQRYLFPSLLRLLGDGLMPEDMPEVTLDALIPGAGPVEIEIGPGRGGFLFERALARPEARLIGLEIRLKEKLDRLREARGRSGVAVAASPDASGQLRDHPTCALWPVALAPEVRAALESGLHRIGQFAAAYDPGRAVFDSQPLDPFLNVNTPEDLRRAARLV